MKGEVLVPNKPQYPNSPPAINLAPPSRMFQIALSEYSFDSAAYSYWELNKMAISLTSKNLPASFNLLNTSAWQYAIPQLYKMYPDKPMILFTYVAQAPAITIMPAGIELKLVVNVELSVMLGSTSVKVMTFQSSTDDVLSMAVKLQPDSSLIIPSVDYKEFNFKLLNSSVGVIGDLRPVSSLMAFAIQNFAIPYANFELSKGFPLPVVEKTKLVNPSLSYYAHYVQVDTDFAPSSA